MRILGIDCGSRCTGYGIIDCGIRHHTLVAFGAIHLHSKNSFSSRLLTVHQELVKLIKSYQPQFAAVEDQFYLTNFRSVLKLGQIKGVVLCTAALANIPVVEYSPLEIKSAVTGYGRAGKKQVQQMVKQLLRLTNVPEPHDAADALALALCHSQVMTHQSSIEKYKDY